MIFCYDLSTQLATFDFYSWLVVAKAKGATEIVFDTRSYGPQEGQFTRAQLRRRFETIIAPGPAMIGLPCREGVDGDRSLSCRLRHLIAFSRSNAVPRLHSPKPAVRTHRYTVTLRKQSKDQYRNSNEAGWRKFADEIGAFVIEDYEAKPIDLHDRLAIYAGAQMNFGIASGPMSLLTLTDYPCMTFHWGSQQKRMEKWGLVYGERMPWSAPHHMTFWEPDSPDNIRREFDRWRGVAVAC